MVGSPERVASSKTARKPAELLDRLAAEIRRTIARADRDQVHNLRVSARRFGQVVAITGGADKIRSRLKRTITLAGAVRDCDIAAKLMRKARAPARLQARIEKRRAAAERELVDALRQWIARASVAKWRAKLNLKLSPKLDRGNAAFAAAERHTLLHAARRLFKRGRKLDGSPRALHQLRIATKKLRYTMELMRFTPARLAPIRKLQSKLGDINDYESTRRIVAKEDASKKVIDSLRAAQEKQTRQFRRYWRSQFAGKEKAWLAILTSPGA